jgi:hypothetical protein
MSNANEPAFPTSVQRGQSGEYWTEDEGGVTKRELFAAMAMQGMLADPNIRGDISELPGVVAAESVAFADALLAELAK